MMKVLAAAILAAVELGGLFGTASAEIDEISDTSMTIDIEVEVTGSAQAVVVHLSFEGEADVTLPLLGRGGGTFGIRTELEPRNYLAVFESIGETGGLSDPVTLREMGADFGEDGVGGSGVADDDLSSDTRQAGWLALALVAASLSALAFWALGGRDEETAAADEEE